MKFRHEFCEYIFRPWRQKKMFEEFINKRGMQNFLMKIKFYEAEDNGQWEK